MADLRVRKNIYKLTLEERETFINALLSVKSSGVYDDMVKVHMEAMSNRTPWDEDIQNDGERNSAHKGPAFLPWHRQYLKVLEDALVDASGDDKLALPYWDWFEDSDLKDPSTALLWTENLVGGNGVMQNGWVVQNGRFKEWPLVHNGGSKPDKLQRRFSNGGLPTKKAREELLATTKYDSKPWSRRDVGDNTFRNLIEGWVSADDGSRYHNQVHVWIGGSMLAGTSPNDPAFYLNHCFVDKLWWDWQVENSTSPDFTDSYAPASGGPLGHNLNDTIFPWEDELVTPKKLLDIKKLDYIYED